MLIAEYCGGSLIDPNWVLTAAHCVIDDRNNKTISVDLRFGKFNGFKSEREDGEVKYKKQKTFPHPKYAGEEFDIALVELDTPINYTSHISPVCLPLAHNRTKPSVHTPVVMIGWGKTEQGEFPDKLQQAVVHVHPNVWCMSSPKGDVICVGEELKEVCSGDSGGPLLLKKDGGGPWVQVGVASYVSNLVCEYGHSGYTDVSYYSHTSIIASPFGRKFVMHLWRSKKRQNLSLLATGNILKSDMTVTYTDASFVRLLFRWNGSVWKAVWKPYVIFIVLYYFINISYRFVFSEDMKVWFEKLVLEFDDWSRLIPIQFLLGFYVSAILARWWEQLNFIAWPDKFLVFLIASLREKDENTHIIRRTIARWCNLVTTLVWKEVSLKIKKRFPTDRHVVDAGLMTEAEYVLYINTPGDHGRWFIPVSWTINLLAKCKEEGKISERTYHKLLEEFYAYRATTAMLTMYDWVNIPLVYTQVVTLATYGYFAFCLLARQELRNDSPVVNAYYVDLYFPCFTTLEFLFYIGWLMVGQALRNPFGEDDEDFAMNYVLDRNVFMAGMYNEQLFDQCPPLVKDCHWGVERPTLPHTKASKKIADRPPHWRLHHVTVNENERAWFEKLILPEETNLNEFKQQ